MNKMMGAINTRGFSSCVSTGILPPDSHITYQGVFNELKFDIGPKTMKTLDCHIGYARYKFTQSLFDSQMNDYLCLFLKSERDGADRNDVPLNTVVCLDISGSMGGCLQKNGKKSRIELSVEAIKMFISKLRGDDSVGLVVFDTSADVLIEPVFKKDLNENVYKQLDELKVRGGTSIASGLTKSKEILKNFLKKNEICNSENRIIMLTDVGDNSIAGGLDFVQQASKEDNIHLTIVGVSNQFKSETCQVLKNIKGFNYFCAINDQDIKKHVFQQFNFNFLPVAHNIQIMLACDNIESFETFGVPDSNQVSKYNEEFKNKQNNQFVVSKTTTIFPSQIQIKEGKFYTIGGVILIKLKKRIQKSNFNGKILIKYRNLNSEIQEEIYKIQFSCPQNEQFYSEQSLREALEGYVFTSEIKYIMRQLFKKPEENLQTYLKSTDFLQTLVPQSKKNDLNSIRKILRQKLEKQQSVK